MQGSPPFCKAGSLLARQPPSWQGRVPLCRAAPLFARQPPSPSCRVTSLPLAGRAQQQQMRKPRSTLKAKVFLGTELPFSVWILTAARCTIRERACAPEEGTAGIWGSGVCRATWEGRGSCSRQLFCFVPPETFAVLSTRCSGCCRSYTFRGGGKVSQFLGLN